MMAVFYGILRPPTFDPSRASGRLAAAILVALAISILLSPQTVDMGGAYYFVSGFSVSSALILLLFSLGVAIRNARRTGRWHSVFGIAWLVPVLGMLPAALAPPSPHRARRGVSYEPWTDVLLVAVAVGVIVTVFYGILRPGTFDRSWGRLATAILFALAMSLLFSPLQLHMSGGFYVVGVFSAFSACLLLLFSLVLAGVSIKDQWRSHRGPPSR
jgi:hypothetical protein